MEIFVLQVYAVDDFPTLYWRGGGLFASGQYFFNLGGVGISDVIRSNFGGNASASLVFFH